MTSRPCGPSTRPTCKTAGWSSCWCRSVPSSDAHLADLDDAERTAALTALVKPYGMTSKDVLGPRRPRKTTRRGLSRADLDAARKAR